jgi:hypothetical protein
MLSKTLVDSIKKQNHNGFPLITMTMSYSCYLTFRWREEREENNYFDKFYRKKNEMMTMGKQLVNFITCSCELSAPFL